MRFDKLTTKFQQALADAQSIALANDCGFIEPAHLLLAMIQETDGGIRSLLERSGVNVTALTRETEALVKRLPQVQGTSGEMQASRDLGNLLNLCDKEAAKRGDQFIASELFLLALCDDKGETGRLCRDNGLNRKSLELAIQAVRGGQNVDSSDAESQREALKKYCLDLTERARIGKLDPVIGRDEEIRRTIQVLSRRTKNNPVLIGEAGVGKTAIAEGLAWRITQGDVPEVLAESQVYALDMGALLAGTKYRGDFEQRLKGVLKSLKDKPHAVTATAEIYTLIGAGAASGGTLDASNLLKPALSSGALKCIGATTYNEYRGVFEKDHALSRRFQKIDVTEPSVEETVAILRGLKSPDEKPADQHRIAAIAAILKAM